MTTSYAHGVAHVTGSPVTALKDTLKNALKDILENAPEDALKKNYN